MANVTDVGMRNDEEILEAVDMAIEQSMPAAQGCLVMVQAVVQPAKRLRDMEDDKREEEKESGGGLVKVRRNRDAEFGPRRDNS